MPVTPAGQSGEPDSARMSTVARLAGELASRVRARRAGEGMRLLEHQEIEPCPVEQLHVLLPREEQLELLHVGEQGARLPIRFAHLLARRPLRVVIACPLDAVDRPAERDDYTPFARRVVHGLVRPLQWIDGAAAAPALAPPGDVPSPVSANLCERLLDMQPEDERASLSVDVAWDASLPPPDGVETGVAPVLRREHFVFLGDLARTLRPHDGDAHPVPLVGHVDRLNGAPDENGRVCGEVVLSLLIDDTVSRAD